MTPGIQDGLPVVRTHGVSAYAKNLCRCEACRLAWRTYIRSRRAGVRRKGLFRGRANGMRVSLTALGSNLARAAAIRERRTVDDIVEAALRCCASRLHFQGRTSQGR